jgi:predicted nucleotidyltransferase
MPGREDVIERIGDVVAGHPVVFSYLFGSFARDDARKGSDVDVAVHFAPGMVAADRFERCLRMGAELETSLGRQVDVVDLGSAPLRLAGRILTERVVVTGLDRPERVRYETDLFPRYIDFDHHARQLDAELLAAMAAGER